MKAIVVPQAPPISCVPMCGGVCICVFLSISPRLTGTIKKRSGLGSGKRLSRLGIRLLVLANDLRVVGSSPRTGSATSGKSA